MSASIAKTDHKVVSQQEWLRASRELLAKEKELTRLSDSLARQRRELPWVKVEKQYTFEGPRGKLSLADLFDGRSQLAVYHFMFGPDWIEGCKACSFLMDHMNGVIEHLAARDVSFVLVSRGPLEKLLEFRQRMGWRFFWVSSAGCDFNRDFGVTFTAEDRAGGAPAYNFDTIPPYGDENPGLSVFYTDAAGTVFHTYSTYARGLEIMLGTYAILDRAPRGRNEEGLKSPMDWLRHHDKYAQPLPGIASCCHEKDSH